MSGISGVVTLGPTCPVMRNPPDPQCADKSYQTNLVLTAPDSTQVIKTFSIDRMKEYLRSKITLGKKGSYWDK
jgi:hypothetical protein